MKIKALNALYQNDTTYNSALEKSIQAFMSIAQIQNYPSAKIQEITLIQQQLTAHHQQNKINIDRKLEEAKIVDMRWREEQKKSIDADFAEARKLMKRTGVGKRIFGLLFLGLSALEVSSMANAEPGNFSGTNFTIALVSFSIGAVLLTSSSGRKRGKILLKQTQERQRIFEQRVISFSPNLNIQQGVNQYGLAVRLRF